MDHPVEFPTYEEHIAELFIDADVQCMVWALDLSTYQGVVDKADRILSRVKNQTMPPPATGRAWTPEKVQTFENWIDNGFQQVKAYLVEKPALPVVRKSLHDLVGGEIDILKKAFRGLQERDADISDPFSFFNLAGIHWYPGPQKYIHCRHHDNEYNPWHRAYLIVFENAMRSVDGCESVTLPYWDIASPELLPDWVFDEPFYQYEYPHDLMDYSGANVWRAKGDPTDRYTATEIRDRVFAPTSPIRDAISEARAAETWERFSGWSGETSMHGAIIEAHDNGHGACGATISTPLTAAFDPLFWFFHCNWDRLWWQWQREHNATTLDTFVNTIEGDTDWLADVPAHILKPFNVKSHDMISSSDWSVDYQPPQEPALESTVESLVMANGSVGSERSFRIASTEVLSIRVKNINRLSIPGSFNIDLLVNDSVVKRTRVFQPLEVSACGNCNKRGVFSKDFRVRREDLPEGAELRVEIHQVLEDGSTKTVPLSSVGNPSVNVRLLLDQN